MFCMEEEIKIEYDESTESDPLSLPRPHDEVSGLPSSIGNSLEIQEAVEIKKVERKAASEISVDDNSESALESNLDDIEEETATWYKAVNSFGKFICNFCDRTYTVITSLRYHINTKHPTKVASLKNKILQKRRSSQHICHLCKKKFNFLIDLKNHIRKHDIENVASSCRYCNAAFIDTQEMATHLKNNHNLSVKKLHICDICGYRTGKLSHFKQHSNIHMTEKRNKCTYCDYSTSNKSNLKNHVRIHTKDKLYKCDFHGCKSGFTDVTALNCHTQKHYPERNLVYCDKCSYKTVYKQSLKVHVESHMR